MNTETKAVLIDVVKEVALDVVILVATKVSESAQKLKSKAAQQGKPGTTTL